MSAEDRFLQYGVSSTLADKAVRAGLTVTTARALPIRELTGKFSLSGAEASELKKCVVRQPIDARVAELLLTRSNHVCCVCKGIKGTAVILHHLVEYEVSQDNSYGNLAVLCPNDHDRAHSSGLSLGLTDAQITSSKVAWEKQVELTNAQTAARGIVVDDDAIDYVNVMRIEEMCVRRFGKVPGTTITPSLRRAGILGPDLRFDEAHVRKKLSGRSYMFDYVNSSETEHYRQLLTKLSEVVDFEDLSEAARSGVRKLRALEGRYAYFIGAVSSTRPKLPITRKTQPLVLHHTSRGVRITWDGDPNYLMSMSSISRQGRTNRYIIYCLVRTVEKPDPKGPVEVTASPLLIAQPSAYVDRTPAIAWRRYVPADDFDDDGNAA